MTYLQMYNQGKWPSQAGIVFVQTSNDPEIIAALQTHATEVSDMADRGLQAVHEMMSKRSANWGCYRTDQNNSSVGNEKRRPDGTALDLDI